MQWCRLAKIYLKEAQMNAEFISNTIMMQSNLFSGQQSIMPCTIP